MSNQSELWQSLLQELGLNRQQANAWQGYVIEVPRELGELLQEVDGEKETIKDAKEEVFQEGSLDTSLILRLTGKPSPCLFKPMAGVSKQWLQLSSEDCHDADNAEKVYTHWLAVAPLKLELTAADYNNIGCVAMWKMPANEQLAHEMFERAMKKGGDDLQIIRQNRQLLNPKPLLEVKLEPIRRVKRDKIYASLWRPTGDTYILGPLD